MAVDGLIYQGLKPVYWSPSSETALAEAEVEYKGCNFADDLREIPGQGRQEHPRMKTTISSSGRPPHGPSRPTSVFPFIPALSTPASKPIRAI